MGAVAVSALVTFGGCSSCGEDYQIDKPEFSTTDQLRPGSQTWRETFTQQLEEADAPHVAARPAAFADWEPVLRFVHVSDVQLRDFGVKYFDGKWKRKVVDLVATEVERLASVDQLDEVAALALIGGLRRAPELQAAFVVHTGDAIDAGTVGEMVRFSWMMNQLDVPWFSAIGNHDVMLMGNYAHDCLTVKDMPADGVPLIGDRPKFMKLHGPGSDWADAASLHLPTVAGNAVVPAGSRLHGFDLGDYVTKATPPRESPRAHYSFPLYTSPPIRVVVLDTTKPDEVLRKLGCVKVPEGHAGFLDETGKKWLAEQIESAAALGEYVLVTGHHPLAPLGTMPSGESVAAYLTAQPRVIGYLAGHTHTFSEHPHDRGALGAEAGAAHKILPEIISTATRVDPAFGLLIEILRKDDRLALVYRSIAPRAHGELGAKLQTFCTGAAKDRKQTPKCDADQANGFIVATGVKAAPRTAGWDAALPAWREVRRDAKDLGAKHGQGSGDPHPCVSNEWVKTTLTVTLRNERDRTADLAFVVRHKDIEVVDQAFEGEPSRLVDEEIRDGLDPDRQPEHQSRVIVGRKVKVSAVPPRATVAYQLTYCSGDPVELEVTPWP